MIWYQIVEWFEISTLSDKVQLFSLQNINKFLIIQQFDIKSCHSYHIWRWMLKFHFDTSNTKISKKERLKTIRCESRGEIGHCILSLPNFNDGILTGSVNKLLLVVIVEIKYHFLYQKQSFLCTNQIEFCRWVKCNDGRKNYIKYYYFT